MTDRLPAIFFGHGKIADQNMRSVSLIFHHRQSFADACRGGDIRPSFLKHLGDEPVQPRIRIPRIGGNHTSFLAT